MAYTPAGFPMLFVVLVLSFLTSIADSTKPMVRDDAWKSVVIEQNGQVVELNEALFDKSGEPTVRDGGDSLIALDSAGGFSDEIKKLQDDVQQIVNTSFADGKVTDEVKMLATFMSTLVVDLQNRIDKASQDGVSMLGTVYGQFQVCEDTRGTAEQVQNVKALAYTNYSTAHKSCRHMEARKFTKHAQCVDALAPLVALQEDKTAAFHLAQASADNVGNHKQGAELEDFGHEPTLDYITRLAKSFEDLHADFTDKLAAKDTATQNADGQAAACDQNLTAHETNKKDCDKTQEDMDNSACAYALKINSVCDAHTACIAATQYQYTTAVSAAQGASKLRQDEYEASDRIECMLRVLTESTGGTVDKTQIDACSNYPVDVDHLVLEITESPVASMCVKATPHGTTTFPCNDAYKAKEYKDYPLEAPVQECSVCSALAIQQ